MAAQFDATGDLFFRLAASSVPQRVPLTMSCFVRADADVNTAEIIFMRYADAAGGIRQGAYLDYVSSPAAIFASAQSSGTNEQLQTLTPGDGLWRHVAVRITQGPGQLNTQGFVGGVLLGANFASTDTADTSASIACGSSGLAAPACSIAHWRIWEDALSDAEILAESQSLVPVRTANLWADYRFESGALDVDSSGNSRSLTANGTPVFVADPTLTLIVPIAVHHLRQQGIA